MACALVCSSRDWPFGISFPCGLILFPCCCAWAGPRIRLNRGCSCFTQWKLSDGAPLTQYRGVEVREDARRPGQPHIEIQPILRSQHERQEERGTACSPCTKVASAAPTVVVSKLAASTRLRRHRRSNSESRVGDPRLVRGKQTLTMVRTLQGQAPVRKYCTRRAHRCCSSTGIKCESLQSHGQCPPFRHCCLPPRDNAPTACIPSTCRRTHKLSQSRDPGMGGAAG